MENKQPQSPRPDIESEFNDSINIVSSLGDMLSVLGELGARDLGDETMERAGASIYWESAKIRKLFYELLENHR